MALIVVTWFWGRNYSPEYVTKLANGVKRNLKRPYRFACISEDARIVGAGIESWKIQDPELLKDPGCIVRMRMFDPAWQESHGIAAGDRIVDLDIDMVITDALDELFDRPEPFCILQGINSTNPCKTNGSVFTFDARYRPDVWTDFSLANYKKLGVPFHSFPDDQGWMDFKMPDSGAFGPDTGVYGFKKRGWPAGDALPKNAKIVAFPGHRDPSKLGHLDWVRDNWK